MNFKLQQFERYRDYTKGDSLFKQWMLHSIDDGKVKEVVPEGVLFITPREMRGECRVKALLRDLFGTDDDSEVSPYYTLYTMGDGHISGALQFAPFFVSSDPQERPDKLRDPVIYFAHWIAVRRGGDFGKLMPKLIGGFLNLARAAHSSGELSHVWCLARPQEEFKGTWELSGCEMLPETSPMWILGGGKGLLQFDFKRAGEAVSNVQAAAPPQSAPAAIEVKKPEAPPRAPDALAGKKRKAPDAPAEEEKVNAVVVAPPKKREAKKKKVKDSAEDSSSDDDDTTSRHGSYIDKHCSMGNCLGKKITGRNWWKHYTKHQSDGVYDESLVEKCQGKPCIHCDKVVKGSKSVHAKFSCTSCGALKRKDLLKAGLCAQCGSQSGSRRSSQKNKVSQDLPRTLFEIADSTSNDDATSSYDISPDDFLQPLSVATKSSEPLIPARVVPEVPSFAPPTAIEPLEPWQQIVKQLRDIVGSKRPSFAKTVDLLDIAENLYFPTVLQFLEESTEDFKLQAQSLFSAAITKGGLGHNQMMGLLISCVCLGGQALSTVSKVIEDLLPSSKDTVEEDLRLHLQTHFGKEVGAWLSSRIACLDDHIMVMARHLIKKPPSLVDEILTVARVVFAVDHQCEEIVKVVRGLSYLDAAPSIFKCIKCTPQAKLTYEVFCEVIDFCSGTKQCQIISAHKEKLITTPLNRWVELITGWQRSGHIPDGESVDQILATLFEFGKVNNDFKNDLLKASDNQFKQIFSACHGTQPNNMQFATAQYIMGRIYDTPRQLWNVASGHGKSRISAAIALIALLKGCARKVHLLFGTRALMERDRSEFSHLWSFTGDGSVEYHCDTNFVVGEGELLIIDEADTLMFEQTESLIKVLGSCSCVALTATPHNDDPEGVEKTVTQKLQFSCFHYPGNRGIDLDTLKVSVEELPLSCSTEAECKELVDYIRDLLKSSPVLLYCDSALRENFEKSAIPFIDADTDLDAATLRTLEKRVDGGLYRLVIASKETAMRGTDFRASGVPIVLIIAQSFENRRSLAQGLCRVGRFGDDCKRMVLKGISLVDTKKEITQASTLFSYLNSIAPVQKAKELKGVKVPTSKTSKKKQQQQMEGQQKLTFSSTLPKQRLEALLGGPKNESPLK